MLWNGTPYHLNQPYVDSLRQIVPYASLWLLFCFMLWVWKRKQASGVAGAEEAPSAASVAASEVDALATQLRKQVVQSVPGSASHAVPCSLL